MFWTKLLFFLKNLTGSMAVDSDVLPDPLGEMLDTILPGGLRSEEYTGGDAA